MKVIDTFQELRVRDSADTVIGRLRWRRSDIQNTVPHYKKAPITEALIDLQVRLTENFAVARLQQAVGEHTDFVLVQELKQGTIEASLGEQLGAVTQTKSHGFIFCSNDKQRVLQARLDGFTFSRLPPYNGWEALRDEAKTFWEIYRTIAAPEAVTRIALKYVNRFDLPLPVRDFKDFFRTYPEVSSDLPQNLSGFFSQIQLPYRLPKLNGVDATLVLTQALVPPPQQNFVSLVLDVDLFCANNPTSDEQEIWRLLEHFRQGKNAVFEGCITNATRELIS